MMAAQFSISVFSADCLNVGKEVEKIDKSKADMIHIDVMDGRFVELYGINQLWLERIHEVCQKPMDVHFMAAVTGERIRQFDRAYVKTMFFHLEAFEEDRLQEAISLSRERGKRTGLALSPETATESIVPYLTEVDEILIMSAYPGRIDSEYLPQTVGKIREARAFIKMHGQNVMLSVDGGLSEKTAFDCICAGADKIIIGRCFYSDPNIIEVLKQSRN